MVLAEVDGAEGTGAPARRLEQAFAEIVVARRGRLVKPGARGVMGGFASAADAVTAAIEMQRAAEASPPVLPVRVGLAAGDVTWDDDDECFGAAVVVAWGLASAAGGGRILVSAVARELADGGASFQRHGPVDTGEVTGEVEAYELAWRAPAPGDDEEPPLPAPLLARPGFDFVGRAEELGVLGDTWSAVQTGGRRILLLGGEAGVGKTRLALEFARACHAEGATVLVGGCDSELAVPYQPWVQALEHLVRAQPALVAGADSAREIGELSVLVPSIDRAMPGLPTPSTSDPESDRYRLFSAVNAVLARATRAAPVVLVVDDLHWAGVPTLALLRFLARNTADERLLVIGTFRDTGDEVTEPLASCLAELHRLDGVTRLRMAGLDATSVEAFVAGATGQQLDDGLRSVAATVAERSGGNAFYVCELWRHLVGAGVVSRAGGRWTARAGTARAGVPDSVKEVVRARLTRLSTPARTLIDVAAVAGARVDVRVVGLAADLSDDDTAAGFDELVDAGLLGEVRGPIYQFSHILVREAVEDTLAPMARARLHLRIADALEYVYESDTGAVTAALALHYAAAAPMGGSAKAVQYGRRAAAQAVRAVAYEEAISHFETAIALSTPDTAERVELLLELCQVLLHDNQMQPALRYSREAFAGARALDDGVLAAHAALNLEMAVHFPGLPGQEAVAAVSQAMTMVGESPLRLRLQAALARAYSHAGRLDEAMAMAENVLDAARRSHDLEAHFSALEAALIATSDPHLLLALGAELDTIDNGDPWHVLYATTNQIRALIALGRLDEARQRMERHREASRRFPTFQFVGNVLDASLLLAAGRFDEAEAAAERAHELGARNVPFDEGVYGLQMFAIRREQGRLHEVAPVVRVVAAMDEQGSFWRPGLAALFADLGMLEDARREFDAIAPDRFAAVPRDAVWPACLAFLADVCTSIGDRERAPVLLEELVEFRSANLMVGMTICLGPADRFLGNLAALLGRTDAAAEHYEVALALAQQSRSPVWEARVLHDYARLLAATGDAARAVALGERARELAHATGMASLASLPVPGASGAADPGRSRPDGLSAREVDVLGLVADGLSNREIGEKLHISQNTVANHVRAILQKTACANRAEAAAYAVRRGLAGP
jgi:DNA-binding CsgD family transcriptional regulator